MSRDVPSSLAMLKSIWLSFAKMVKAPTIYDASRQLLNQISIAIGDLIFNNNMHQCRHRSDAITWNN